MMLVPRTMVNPSVRFSSDSTRGAGVLPGACVFATFLFTRRNSSVSARTRFMYCPLSVQGCSCSGTRPNLVECQHLPSHLPSIIQYDAHTIVDLPPDQVHTKRRVERNWCKLTRFCYSVAGSVTSINICVCRNRIKSGETYHLALPVGGHLGVRKLNDLSLTRKVACEKLTERRCCRTDTSTVFHNHEPRP